MTGYSKAVKPGEQYNLLRALACAASNPPLLGALLTCRLWRNCNSLTPHFGNDLYLQLNNEHAAACGRAGSLPCRGLLSKVGSKQARLTPPSQHERKDSCQGKIRINSIGKRKKLDVSRGWSRMLGLQPQHTCKRVGLFLLPDQKGKVLL